jgi:hypothetical protein
MAVVVVVSSVGGFTPGQFTCPASTENGKSKVRAATAHI